VADLFHLCAGGHSFQPRRYDGYPSAASTVEVLHEGLLLDSRAMSTQENRTRENTSRRIAADEARCYAFSMGGAEHNLRRALPQQIIPQVRS
jgi:hypothetical protein